MSSGAQLSPCRTWRYSLWRDLPPGGYGQVTFVGLNPSTADETNDDPTIRRCLGFAAYWGYARLMMVNLYAFRATKPADLWLADDPVGPGNFGALSTAFGGSHLIVLAWGANARANEVERFADDFGRWGFHALGVTKDGAPRHPLYLRADSRPFLYDLHARVAS